MAKEEKRGGGVTRRATAPVGAYVCLPVCLLARSPTCYMTLCSGKEEHKRPRVSCVLEIHESTAAVLLLRARAQG